MLHMATGYLNFENASKYNRTFIQSLFHRLLLWNCPSECDYTCQHIITAQRVSDSQPVVQFHGKWPFYRFLGIQEPFSVLFSLLNFLAHQNGLSKLHANIPASYSLRRYYVLLAYFGMASWAFSMIFHTRDFTVTEELDYFAAGGSVLYGMYYTPIRIFRLDRGGRKTKSLLRAWTVLCIGLYAAHVGYLKWLLVSTGNENYLSKIIMAFAYSLHLRVVQGLFAVIILGLMAYVNSWSYYWSPSSANFLLFVSVWTLLTLLYLTLAPLHFPTAAHKFGILGAEALAMLFWFAGFIAFAVLLTDIGCGRHWAVCRASEAAVVFAAFEWLLFAATTIMASLHVWRTKESGDARPDPDMEVHPTSYPSV
ncbi:hypothetical protein B7494_g8216 [Chlorociboria aeruginascens]|nr:hypothetical protein B7494_g8216 [Chlorociboria aeruginascens]